MTDQKKEQRIKGVTPAGRFQFPKIFTPDTKFKTEGEYSVKVRFTEEEAEPLIEFLNQHYDAAIEAGRAEYAKLPVKVRKQTEFKVNPFYHDVYDEETEEPTGEVEFNFKALASGISKKTNKPWKFKPNVFAANGKPVLKDPGLWSGTVGKVAFEVSPYFVPQTGCGISLRLNAVQILELRTGQARTADGYGFGIEEGYDGYVPSDEDDEDDAADEDDDELPPFSGGNATTGGDF